MHVPSAVGIYFLIYLLVLLPMVARKSARRFAEANSENPAGRELISPARIWISSLIGLLLTGTMAWLAGRDFDYPFWLMEHFGVRDLLAGIGALLLNAGFFVLSRRWRTEEARRKLAIWRLVPRSGRDWALVSLGIVAAGVCEEIAYRGVAMSLLWWMTDSAWVAVAICALAFAAAHAVQGTRSMLIILCMALVAHALVAVTETLIVAMVVHVIYDFGAVFASSKQAAKYLPEEAT